MPSKARFVHTDKRSKQQSRGAISLTPERERWAEWTDWCCPFLHIRCTWSLLSHAVSSNDGEWPNESNDMQVRSLSAAPSLLSAPKPLNLSHFISGRRGGERQRQRRRERWRGEARRRWWERGSARKEREQVCGPTQLSLRQSAVPAVLQH